MLLVIFSVRDCVDLRAIVRSEGLRKWEFPMAPSGIKPANFRLVTQCLNQLRHRIAQTLLLVLFNTTNIKDTSHDGTQVNTLRTGDADLRFYITTVQDGWRKSAFLTSACFPCTIHLIMQYIEPVSEWFCWRIFIETWPHSELNFRHRASLYIGTGISLLSRERFLYI